jgi:OmpA-OmpF porin, OOP family
MINLAFRSSLSRMIACCLLFAPPAYAQSTITLESFDLPKLGPDSAVVEDGGVASNNLAACLLSAADCEDGQANGRSFSLDDVVNLGIVKRNEVAVPDTSDPVQAAQMAEPLPSIDLEVLFEYASDELRSDQIRDLYLLAQQLRSIDFTSRRLVLMGHTDAAGSAAYNRDLSLRRAVSVAEFLIREAGIPSDRIRPAGMGFEYLKFPDDPLNDANRRVQFLLIEG